MKKNHDSSLVLARYMLAIEAIRLANKLVTLLNMAINYKSYDAFKMENTVSA